VKVVVVSMVKDEERYIGAAMYAVRDFADHVVVIDTGSTDATVDRAEAALAGSVTYEIHSEPILTRTHRFVEGYVGTDTWVFGVDGDEVFDKSGLETVKEELAEFDYCWQVKGVYLHATQVDRDSGTVTGYMGPPSWNPTKLYNFRQIKAWPSDGERTLFHCKTLETGEHAMRDTAYVVPWVHSPLRCLHMRHMQGNRLNPEDLIGHGSASDRGPVKGENQRRSYRMGPLETVSLDPFEEALTWQSS
jgi:glycosyltransferase involved in cell wall biosynthesis